MNYRYYIICIWLLQQLCQKIVNCDAMVTTILPLIHRSSNAFILRSSRRGTSFSSPIQQRLFSKKSIDDDDDNNNNELSSSSSLSEYSKSYQLNGIGELTKVEIITNTGHKIQTDIPKKMGGTDIAPQPVETLIAAWMGCTQATALFVGRHIKPQRILITKLQFNNIQAFRDERGALELPIEKNPIVPSRIHHITGTIYVFAQNPKNRKDYIPLSSEQLHLLREQTEIRCPVANMMIASGCLIDVEWVDGVSYEEEQQQQPTE